MRLQALLITLLLPLALWAQPCQTTIAKNVVVSDFSAVRDGSVMTVSMTFVLDALSVRADQQLVLTPVLINGADTVAMPRVFINGRRQQIMYERGNDPLATRKDLVVRRRNGKPQSVGYRAAVAWREWMDNYTAAILEDDCGCGRLLGQNASDILVVRPPYQPELAFIAPPVERKTFTIEKKARITFIVDKTYLDPTYMQNPSELDSIYRTIQLVRNDPNITITNINIHGTASPESPYEHNTELASGRANTIKEYVNKMVELPAEVFSSSYTPENWAELTDYIEASNLPNKQALLAICRDEATEPDAREAKLKKLYPDEYQHMYRNWYPDLRRTTYRVQYVVREFSVEEAKAILRTKPQQLSLNELYRVAQTYPLGSDSFNEVMEIAVRLHPDDTFANLNAAVTRLSAGDTEGAKRFIDGCGTSPEALNARGVIAYRDGDRAAALSFFREAADRGLAEAQRNAAALQSDIYK